MPQNKLIIFVKNEEAGKVKTRLAKSVGEEKALEIYQTLLRYTHTQVASLEVTKEVWYTRFTEKNDIWSNGKFKKQVQAGKDLGERMSDAFQKTLEKEEFDKAVIIGSDCGELTGDLIKQAFISLDEYDVVLGPASDGGYYLLGMKTYYPKLFLGISWSTEKVLQQTLEKAAKAGSTTYLLQELNDVDEIADWQRIEEKFEIS